MGQATDHLFSAFLRPKTRTLLEFAEQEIVIPDGPFEGLPFSTSRQPYSAIWFELAAGPWYECVITGPSQSGKTLVGFVIPLLYHLFEKRQNVIAAVPDYDMCADKLRADILPVLERTRYREYLPPGRISIRQALIEFKNGALLRWMTAGGSDKSRAAFTSPTVCMTETDGFDLRTSTSDEANKIEQIEARMRAYPLAQRRIYKECTVTVPEGHTWDRYEKGTATKLMTPCPHCKNWVALEREHFVGWANANDDIEATQNGAFVCYACGVQWSEDDRKTANDQMQAVHRGQTVDKHGNVTGELPQTHTLGFRWSAVNNLLVPAADVAIDEYRAARAVDEDDAERKMSQFVWCIPYVPKESDVTHINAEAIARRFSDLAKGQCPPNTKWITVGVDVNKPVLHWTAIAWSVEGSEFWGQIIDYGKQGVRSNAIGFDQAIVEAVSKLHATFGVTWKDVPKGTYHRVVVDSRWSTAEVDRAIKLLKDVRWRPFTGLGQGHWKRRTYSHPETSHGKVWVGNQCYEKYVRTRRVYCMSADANFWKTWLAARLSMPTEQRSDGALNLFRPMGQAEETERGTFARHLSAEKEVIVFEKGKGYTRQWETIRSSNHWLDATYMACVAGNRFWHKLRKKQATKVVNRASLSPIKISPFSKR